MDTQETNDLTANEDLKTLDGLIRTLHGSDLAAKLQTVRDNVKERVLVHGAWLRRVEPLLSDWDKVATLLGVDPNDRAAVFTALEDVKTIRGALRRFMRREQ